MIPIDISSFTANAASPRYDPAYPTGNRGSSGTIAKWDFNAGDNIGTVKNGVYWDNSAGQIATPPGESEQGLVYKFWAVADPSDDTGSNNGINADTSERYFHYTPHGTELYVKRRYYIPTNYYHRRCLALDMSGSMASWQVGDSVYGFDTGLTATIYYKNGSLLYLLFATNDYGGGWANTVTNITRSQTLNVAQRIGVQHDNNKNFVLYCDGYSAGGKSPSVVWEMRADSLGGSLIYSHYAVDGNGANFDSDYVPFINAATDLGTWMDVIYRVKMASNEAATDGLITVWQRKEGASVYTKILNVVNAAIGPRAAATPPNAVWMGGYCNGACNSGFPTDTRLYESYFEMSTTTIDGVV